MKISLVLGTALFVAPLLPAQTQQSSASSSMQSMWRCDDPERPFRYVEDEAKKKDPPPCQKWVEVRAENLQALLAALGQERFVAANVFLSRAAEITDAKYPDVAGHGVTTTTVFRDPSRFGLTVVDTSAATPGSLVVYEGLGGILVETRELPTGQWKKQVLYPSAAAGGELLVRDLVIPGVGAPKVIAKPY